MIFRIRRYSAMGAHRGPKMAPKLPKMAPRRPQHGPKRLQERPKKATGRLKMAQERPTRAPKGPREGHSEGPKSDIGPKLAQRPLWEAPRTRLDPSGESPGTLPGASGELPGPPRTPPGSNFGKNSDVQTRLPKPPSMILARAPFPAPASRNM